MFGNSSCIVLKKLLSLGSLLLVHCKWATEASYINSNTLTTLSVTIVSIVRLRFILGVDLQSPDITWNFIDAIIWSNVECDTAIVCGTGSAQIFTYLLWTSADSFTACLPALKPLLTFALKGTMKSSTDPSKPRSGAVGSKYANKMSKGTVSLGGYSNSFGSRVQSGIYHTSTPSDDERPFARSHENDGNEHDIELGSMGHPSPKAGEITVTREFVVRDSKRPFSKDVGSNV
jgi:hypothetical protein